MRQVLTAVVGSACLVGAAGCGTGQAVADKRSPSPGALGAAGAVQVRNAQIARDDPPPGDAGYAAGADARLRVTIVNGTAAAAPDRLLAVSSPVATSVRIEGDTTIPDGQALVAGYDRPAAASTLDGAREVRIVLEDLLLPVRAGSTYPVTFAFARAGDVRLEVGVESPEPDLAVITAGGGVAEVPGDR